MSLRATFCFAAGFEISMLAETAAESASSTNQNLFFTQVGVKTYNTIATHTFLPFYRQILFEAVLFNYRPHGGAREHGHTVNYN